MKKQQLILIFFLALYSTTYAQMPESVKKKFSIFMRDLAKKFEDMKKLFDEIKGIAREVENSIQYYEDKLFPKSVLRFRSHTVPVYVPDTLVNHRTFRNSGVYVKLNIIISDLEHLSTTSYDAKVRITRLLEDIRSSSYAYESRDLLLEAKENGERDIFTTVKYYYRSRTRKFQELITRYDSYEGQVQRASLLLAAAQDLIADYPNADQDLQSSLSWEKNWKIIRQIVNELNDDPGYQLYYKCVQAESRMLTPINKKFFRNNNSNLNLTLLKEL